MKQSLIYIIATVLLFFDAAGGTFAQSTPADSSFRELFDAAQSAKAAGRFDEAIADLARLEKMNPGVAEVHATLGVLYYQQGDYARAIAEIRDARRLKPALPGLDALLAFSLAESGHEREALRELEKAFRGSADAQIKRQAGLELVRAYSHLEMDRNAVETALALRDQYKTDPEVLYNVGKVLGNSAYVTMQSLFHQAPSSPWVHLAEGEALESQGRLQDAIEEYRQVLAISPHKPNMHYRIGRALLKRWDTTHSDGDSIAARDEFVAELNGNPTNANAAYELAGLYRQSGNLAEAERLYASATQLYPDFEEAQVGLGGVLIDEGKPAEAISHLARATELRPDDPVAWYRLSHAQRAAGNRDAALVSMARFQKLHTAQASLPGLNSADEVTPQKLEADANAQ